MKKPLYKRKRTKPVIDHTLEFIAIDLKKLEAAPQKIEVLRLLTVLNDLDAGSYAFDKIAKSDEKLPNALRERWSDGVTLYLMRIRVALIYSTLYDILSKIREKVVKVAKEKRTTKTPRYLWHVILDDDELYSKLQELVETLRSGEVSDSMAYVRDKMSAHIDCSVMSIGLKKLVEQESTGIALRTRKPEQRFRTLFVDDILSFSWQEKALINVDLDEYMKSIADVRRKTADFAYRLFDLYCKEFSLRASSAEHDRIKKEAREELAGRSKRSPSQRRR